MEAGTSREWWKSSTCRRCELCTEKATAVAYRCASCYRDLDIEHYDLRGKGRHQRHDARRAAKYAPDIERDRVDTGECQVDVGTSSSPLKTVAIVVNGLDRRRLVTWDDA